MLKEKKNKDEKVTQMSHFTSGSKKTNKQTNKRQLPKCFPVLPWLNSVEETTNPVCSRRHVRLEPPSTVSDREWFWKFQTGLKKHQQALDDVEF